MPTTAGAAIGQPPRVIRRLRAGARGGHPGGTVDKGEGPEQCAAQESLEETGLGRTMHVGTCCQDFAPFQSGVWVRGAVVVEGR
ncbi:NUDIX hydrolase [Streptomyces sp. NPDC086766]|uniref:NUDIX hydrolase n=1 Tax=Streptomyces sp. NPDC086766 TaxID=3365754 RepID=UPI0038191985